MCQSIKAVGKRVLALGVSCMLASVPIVVANADGGHDRKGSNGNNSTSPCERTAHAMASSCRLDVKSELHLTLANCNNLLDRNERRDCFEEASTVRKEEAHFCGEVLDGRLEACAILGESRYADPLLDSANSFIDPDDIPGTYPANPYVSLAAGHTYVLRAGEEGEELVVVHVTGESREILGVQCRVVKDVVVEVDDSEGNVEYEAVEVTDDWFAQDDVGNVYYCGEISRNFEDGVLRNLDGSFEAGRDFAQAGTIILSFPVSGHAHRTEFALGEAEDMIQYVDLQAVPTDEEGGDNPLFPCSTGGGPGACLKTFDFAPIEPESTEFKYYLPDTGFVLAVSMEDGELTGEREELVCVGESLDLLQDPGCGIEDPAILLEELCELAPDAFCNGDDATDE